MLEFPSRVWLAQREYARFDGIEHVEAIVRDEDIMQSYRDEYDYEVTEYVAAKVANEQLAHKDHRWDEMRHERDTLLARVARLEAALELIATPSRADGTYNRSRGACEQLAREALQRII